MDATQSRLRDSSAIDHRQSDVDNSQVHGMGLPPSSLNDTLNASEQSAEVEPTACADIGASGQSSTESVSIPITSIDSAGDSMKDASPSREQQLADSIELDSDAIIQELRAIQHNEQQVPVCMPVPFESEPMLMGLKPESVDPFLFDSIGLANEQASSRSSPEMLNVTAHTPGPGTLDNSFSSCPTGVGLRPHGNDVSSPFTILTQQNWCIDDFIGTPIALPTTEISELQHPAAYPYISQMLDEYGRRRSQSMPPQGSFTFKRKMEDGRMVGITKGTAQQNVSLSTVARHSSTAPPAAQSLRHHPYDRTSNVRNGGSQGRTAVKGRATPRSYPTTTNGATPRGRTVASIENNIDGMSLDIYHSPASSSYNPGAIPEREDKRRTRELSKKGPPPTTLLSPRHELEAFATPILVQLDAFRNSIFQQIHELRSTQYDPLETERSRQRAQNRQVTHLNQHLTILAGHMHPSQWAEVPRTGLLIRDLNQGEMTNLLDRYGVPYVSNMFLHEKKALYLQFLGCNRAFMHRVLDYPE